MSLPHPSTTAQPSTQEANGVIKELLAMVTYLIPHDLDFHPEALASCLQLANRIATVIVSEIPLGTNPMSDRR